MEIEIGRGKKARRAYGFDDIAIVPSRRTRDPDDVDISWKLGDYRFELPLLASAMDGVVSPKTAGIIGKLGGLAVLNLEGIFTRYEDADEQLERIAELPKDSRRARCRRSTSARRPRADHAAHPRDQGPGRRRRGVADAAAVRTHYELALDAGLDILVIQGTVVSAEHVSSTRRAAAEPQGVHQARSRCRSSSVAARATTRLCTSCAPARPACSSGSAPARRVRRVAFSALASRRRRRSPMSRAPARSTCSRPASTSRSSPTAACATAATSPRRSPVARTRRWSARRSLAPMRLRAAATTGAWRCSTRRCLAALACGPCRTARWRRSLGPATRTTARSTSWAALRTSMATCGYKDIAEFNRAELMIAPALQTEGKQLQVAQGVGMGARGSTREPAGADERQRRPQGAGPHGRMT